MEKIKTNTSLNNLIEIQRDYLLKICKNIDGLKCMVLDSATSELISLNFLQSEGFEMEVFLFENINNLRDEKLGYVSAIYLITASSENLSMLCDELRDPHFKDYSIFFLTDVSDDLIRRLAECDEKDLIRHLQRLYCNYHAINPELFHSDSPRVTPLLKKSVDQWTPNDMKILDSMEESLFSALCSIRQIPTIRYMSTSNLASHLGDRLSTRFRKLAMSHSNDFKKKRTMLLIIERKEDPFTPLMFHWTYQAMLHELIGISANKISLKGKEYNLNLQHDDFYEENLFSNYGEVAGNLKTRIDKLSDKKKQHKEVKQFEDMQRLLSEMHDFQKSTAITEKHFALADEISRQVGRRDLLNISKVEQDILAKDSRKEHFREVIDIMRDQKADKYDKFRLVVLFSLRYQNTEQARELQMRLGEMYPMYSEAINQILSFCDNKTVSKSLGTNIGEKAFKIYQDYFNNIPNVYEQHVPLVVKLVEEALKNKLSDMEFPFVDSAPLRQAPTNVVVFIVGGVSPAEAKHFRALNEKYEDSFFLLGGSSLVNSRKFLHDYIGLTLQD